MTEEIKQLLIDCANFIQPYDDGGNEAERLIIRLDEACSFAFRNAASVASIQNSTSAVGLCAPDNATTFNTLG